jgi:serine/threonine-protein kinase RsbT
MSVASEFDVAAVIGVATGFCVDHGFPRLYGAHVATAASELANNLWMHAVGGGQITIARLDSVRGRGVELIATDDGPGIADIALALTEGYSSAGGLGCGLPGVRRLMDEFEIDSGAGRGTRVVARKWSRRG